MNQVNTSAARTWPLWAAVSALVLSGCGGGDDEAPAPVRTYFAVEGAQSTGGIPVTICVDQLAYTDPASEPGRAIASRLVRYYGIVSGYRSFAGTGRSCRERFPSINYLLSVSEYNNLVMPGTPAPGPPPGPAPTPGPPPPPPPLPPALPCTAQGGNGTNGLSLYGQTSYSGLPSAALTTGTVSFDPGEVSFVNPNIGSSSTTGSLRAQLWAVGAPYAGGGINGYIVTTYSVRFSSGATQLRNGESANLNPLTLSARTPPGGAYCMVMTLEEYDSNSCSSADRYCIVDWYQYSPGVTFR